MFMKALAAAGGLAAGLALATPAAAEASYEGETVTVIINLGAGGSTGVMAQLFANHWKEKLTGNPDFVVTPVTGGAQMKGIIEAQNARPDGTTTAWVAWSGPTRAIGPAAQRVDWSKFDVIAGMGVPSMAYMRNDVGGGVSSVDDLKGLEGIRIGGYRPGSYLDLTARISLDILGIPHDYTTGFGGGSKIVAALQRDEVNFHVTPAGNYFGGIEDNVVGEGIGLPLWYYELEGAETGDAFGDMPSFASVAQDMTGQAPSGPLWETLQWLNEGMAGVTWFIGVPAGVDEEQLALLRSSFAETMQDPAFLEEVAATTGIVPTYTSHEAMEALIEGLNNVDPAISETVKGYIASGSE
ncbi:hypothetical protein FHY55_04895 [Oceanicola sp. D3]|uniref:hypothetical protein n=1 Tax=Oceanicola sp. D3 TaxID=2587163 RepID=UPI00111FB51A|nr:hypothetical protein [Oceanicola sp. D3]QDC08617.1 hypothetical protein FHY55_04895 [Oceanicola sp. D3]